MRFAATFDANGVRKGAAEAVASMKSVSVETDKASASLRNAAKDAGHYYDALGRLHRADGKFASSAESAAVKAGTLTASVRKATDQTRALGSSSEKAGKQIQGFGSGSDSASKSLAKASSVADALNQRFASLTQRVLSVYAAYKLLDSVVATTNVGIQANTAWESQKLSIASIVSSTNQLADAQGRVLEGSEKFVASQQVAEKLMQRLQQLGLETTATTQELVNGFQAIIAPALKAGYALEEIPELATRAAQAMGAFQIPVQQMRTEVESLLSGNINKAQDLLAPYLGVTKELVTQWRQQGILVEEINKRLESFKYSGDAIANTWTGLTSNLEEYYQFISRGSTDGLFNSMKQSVRELQSLMITMNQKTGLAEVSSNVNNITAAWERMNDFIGNKIIVATMKFTDWIEELNRPGNLAELERSVSNIGLLLEDASGIASKVALEVGGIAKKAIDGYNELPEWMRDMGLVGAFVMGKRGWLALGAASALIDRGKNFATGIDLFVNTSKMSMQELSALSWDKLHEMVEEADKSSKEAAEKSKQNFTSAAFATTASLKREYEQREQDLKDTLEQEYRNLKAYQEASKVPLVGYIYDDKARDSQEHINELQEKLSAINLQLEYTFEKSFAASQAVDNIGVSTQALDEMPLQQLVGTIQNLQTGADLFARKLFGAKEAVSDLDGSTAIVSLDFQYTIPEKKGLDLFGASGGTTAGWLEQQIGVLDAIYGRIEATSSLGSRAADDGKKKTKQIESALHSVESDLNRLQMTDAGFRQFQIDQKVADLEKTLGATNPRVQELRAELEKKLQDDFLEEVIGYADPAEKQMIDLQKAYQKFNDTLKASAKLDAEEKFDLQAKAAKRYAHEIDEVNTEQKQLLEFQKETSRIEAENSNDQATLWQMKVDRYEKELWYVEDIAERRSLIEGRINAELAVENKRYTADFGKMWEETYNRVDQAGADMLENFLSGTKNTFDSLKKMFIRTLAEMANAAWLRPITVQIMGTLGGVFGVGGTALAYDSATGKMVNASGSGLLGNIPFSSILPDSWTSGAAGLFSGITGGINSFGASALPSLFAANSGQATVNAALNSMAGTSFATSTLLGTLGAGLSGFGIGSLAGQLLFPNQPNISTGAGIGGGLGAAIGSVVPGIGTLLGGTIGSLLGGGIGSLFGGGRRTHASVYGKMEDVGFSRDQQTYIDAFMGGAWYDRSGKKEAEPFAQGIAQVASQTAGSLLDIAGALPEQIRQSALSGLETSTWSAGRGVSDASWNFQWWEEGMAEERLEEAAKDMRNRMTAVAQQVFSNAGISRFFDSFDVTTDEGLQKASTALSAISAVKSATDAIKSPLSEMEQQAQSAKAQLDAWTQGMKDSGVNAQYAAGLINEYRNAFINDYIKTLDESLHPLSAYAQAVKAANEAVDQRKKALEIIGATEGQLAQVEAMRAEVVKQATEEMLRSFGQSVAQRWAAVNGNSDAVGRAISQANELRETIRQFGEGSAQVAELLKLHAAETAKAAQDAAKSEYDSLKAQMDALEQQRVQLQQQAIQEQINAINEQINTAKTLKSTWEGLDKSLGQSRYNLFAGSANLDAENRLGTVQAEFRRLSGLALGGDSDAAGQLAGVGNSLLDLVKQTAGTEEEYLDAFFAVNAQLKSAQDAAGAQVSAADKQLEALQGQLDVQNAALKQLQGQSATLEEIEKQIADLKPLLDAAGQKAGVKAFARGGLAMPGWSLVGEEGPELVNFSQPGRVYTAADTAALFRSATPRAADADSGSDAEVKALRREVYQLRRDMLISMSEIARFSRRTSDMVEAWDAEGMPGVRA